MIRSTFPRIRHLPTSHASADDLWWSDREAHRFLEQPVVVVEKLDGINVTFARGPGGRIESALKSDWSGSLDGALARAVEVFAWQRRDALHALLDGDLHAHGEWMGHRVSIGYDALPDVFIGTSLLDRRGRFLERLESDARFRAVGLVAKEPLLVGSLSSMARLRALAGRSRFSRARMEGLVVTLRADENPETRYAKWVGRWYEHPTPGALLGMRNRLARGARGAR
jgi:hypothetical protein